LHAPTRLPATKTSPSPCLLSLTGNNVGLRGPTDRFALKSSFFSPSLHLLITSYKHQQQPLAPAAPRFSMRAAAKQAYICRDCGYIYNDRKPLKSYLIITSALFVVLLKGDLGNTCLLWQKMIMTQTFEKHVKHRFREMKQLGEHCLSQSLLEL
ncbi:hypothetical protein POPTR_012G109700v4, partial [Populus trichocarpa]